MSLSVGQAVEPTASPDLDAEDVAPTVAPGSTSGALSTGPGQTTAPGLRLVGQQVGKYRVLREIGRGGMGAVFEAIHESIGQRIAIKVLNEEYSSDARHVQRFFDEARAVNIVQHPSLVKVYDFGHLPSSVAGTGDSAGHDGTAYITMEFLAGESLQDRINRLKNQDSRMALHEALRVARQIGSALEAVHEKGIAHRDLKPANLFLVPDREAPGGERVKILDFGIAKFFGSAEAAADSGRHLTTVGKLLGTPVYMSPEQCSGAEQIDDRVDVYALGVIMYQILSGKLPFEAPAACVIMTKHIMEPPPPLAEAEPQLPPTVCALVEEMLAKSAKARPSMAQVVLRLEQLLETEAGLTSAEWRSVHRTRMRKARRWPVLAAAATLLVMTVLLIGVGKYRRAQRGRAANQPANTAAITAPAITTPAAPPNTPPVTTVAAQTAVPPPPAAAEAAAPPSNETPPTAAPRVRKKSSNKNKANPAAPAAPAPSSGGSDIPILR